MFHTSSYGASHTCEAFFLNSLHLLTFRYLVVTESFVEYYSIAMQRIIVKSIQYILLFNFLILSFEVEAQRDLRRLVDLRGYWKFNIGDNLDWAKANYDDSRWTEVFVPSDWEDEGFHGYDGFAWYRVGFELDLDPSDPHEIYLDLGFIDDIDEVYVNGKLIGRTGTFPPRFKTAYNSRRFYYLPVDVLNLNGVNSLSVRVFDTVLNGGIVSGKIGVYANRYPTRNSIMLQGLWKFKRGIREEYTYPDYNDSDWDNIIVPGFWHEMKSNIGSFGTYRKSFRLPESMSDSEDLILVLGKIDDFDRVFINGKFIGETYDGRRFGSSTSYSQRRAYAIPPEVLNRYGENIITVEVENIGGNAGIYEGPVGITTEYEYRNFIRYN